MIAAISAIGPDYHGELLEAQLDWSAYPGTGGGLQGAIEMCNNNGARRSRAGGVMCLSFRVTGDEQHVTRGRANPLRLAITGQLGLGRAHLRRDGGDDGAVRVVQRRAGANA